VAVAGPRGSRGGWGELVLILILSIILLGVELIIVTENVVGVEATLLGLLALLGGPLNVGRGIDNILVFGISCKIVSVGLYIVIVRIQVRGKLIFGLIVASKGGGAATKGGRGRGVGIGCYWQQEGEEKGKGKGKEAAHYQRDLYLNVAVEVE